MYTYPYQIIKRKAYHHDVTELRELEWYTNQDSTKDKNASLKAAPGVYITFIQLIHKHFAVRRSRYHNTSSK
jgi:hypothetical protein